MIRTPEKSPAPSRWRGRRRRNWGPPLLLLSMLALCLALGAAYIFGGKGEPQQESPTPSLQAPEATLSTPTPTPEPTPIPVPELPDWIQEDLLPLNEWSRPGTPMTDITGLVVHYVGNPGTAAWQNRSYFASLAQTHETYASSNFIIGLEGEIILCVPIGEMAYCTRERNVDTLSIEVCHPDKSGKFTQASYESLIRLVNWLREFYDLGVDDVIRHYDVTGKECPLYYVEHEDAWETFKADLEENAQETTEG